MIGTRIGPYEINAKLGEGGMGEVWRARDTQLDRDVAIKVLPAAFTEDRERLARFEREAKLLAQLNHPNIAQIYGLESSGETRALVMELVEGPTLAERLEDGALPLDESLSFARQIAEALEEAHEKGIIHRDLKPQNIKASREGKAKVLDFGLAKAMDPTGGSGIASGSASQLAASPTLTLGATIQGVILGSAAYMSPEQAKGLAVDKRADIWAFGVVLIEMLTGERLFGGDTVPETLAGVLKTEIDLETLPAETPTALRRLLRRCLERQPKNRLHDIADARIVIDDLLAGKDEDSAPVAARAADRNPWPARIGWLVLGAAASAAAFFALRPDANAAAAGAGERPFTLRRVTELPGAELQPTLSPDGRMVVYSSAATGNFDLYLQRVGGDRAIPLTTDPADDAQPAFSPDGERIAFRSERDGGGLFVMGATGESVRRVTDAGFDPAWSPDGKKLAYATEAVDDPVSRYATSELWIVALDTGERTRRLAGDAVQPAWSRRGDRIAYWANTDGQRDLWTVGVESGDPVAVTMDVATDWSPEWSPDDRWLYFSSDRGGAFNLWRIAIDPATGGAAGEPQPVTSGVRGMGYARIAGDGNRLAVMAYERTYEQTLYAVEGRDPVRLRALRTLRNPSARWCSISPDGERLACNTAAAPEDLVVLRADGTEMRRLTSDMDKDRSPTWAPDGKSLVFYSTRSGTWQYSTIGVDGSDLRQRTVGLDEPAWAWLPDGRAIAVGAPVANATEILVLDLERPVTEEPAERIPLPPEARQMVEMRVDHAGDRLLGALATGNGRLQAYVLVDLRSGGSRRYDLPVAGRWDRTIAGWLPDDRSVIVRAADGVRELEVDSGRSQSLLATAGRVQLSLSYDGRILMVENQVLDSDIWLVEYR